ncbi:RNA-directed DNA polymerase, eukaryota, reverse transcriptase zinc-binding domain protein [Tanacetum coccineum]
MFTLLMKKNIGENEKFKYHQGCKKLGITHLCFADDLLVFCHEDCESVGVIKKTLEEFSKYSGLKPNMQKSTMFFGGLSVPEQENLLQIIPFSIGRLPVRYLGVPLVTKQISVKDCKPLTEKVKVKVQDWRNRSLSYAGRLQLIASILSSMQIYWASVFLLPRTIIKEINELLKAFLWCQGELIKGRAKISWENICKPKDQGGLGLKDLQKWNEVLIMKHLWNVAAKKDTLWVKWVHVEKLKGRSIWEVDCDSNSSSVWRNLLDMRDIMIQHVYFKKGNGQSVSAWYDKWCAIGPLDQFITTRIIYDARLQNDSKLQVWFKWEIGVGLMIG